MDEHDMMQESILWPWIDDPSYDCEDAADECNYDPCEEMDGDHESALRDAGYGTDEDYGYYGGDDY